MNLLRLPFLAGLLVLALAWPAMAQPHLAAPALYPNPVAGSAVTVAYPDDGAATPEVEVFDVLGRRVSSEGVLPAGVYLVRLRWPDGRVSAPQPLTKLTNDPLVVDLRPTTAAPSPPEGAARMPEDPERPGCTGPVVWDGLMHAPLGVAQVGLNTVGNLVVSNIGSSGQDGIRTCLTRSGGAWTDYSGFDPDLLQPGFSFEWDLDNDGLASNGVLSRVLFEDGTGPFRIDAEVDLTGLGATCQMVEVWNDDVLAHTATVPSGRVTFGLDEFAGGGVVLGIIMANTEGDFHSGARFERRGRVAAAPQGTAPHRTFGGRFVSQLEFEMLNAVEVHLGSGVYVGDRAIFTTCTTIDPPLGFRESRMQFANSTPIELEDHQLAAMGHFHSADDSLDTSRFLLGTFSPEGPVIARCLPGGCPDGIGMQIWVPQGSPAVGRRLDVGLRPIAIPAGGTASVSFGADILFPDAQGRVTGGITRMAQMNMQFFAAPGGVILQMEKENCDELTGGGECEATLEYRRNGEVMLERAIVAGEPVFFPGSLLVRSGWVAADDEPADALKPITWEIGAGVTIVGGQETIRVYGNGPDADATLAGMTIRSNQPLAIITETTIPWAAPEGPQALAGGDE